MTLTAFHSDVSLKAAVVKAVANIHNPSPYPEPEACSTGCPLHAGSYREIQERLGIPAPVLAMNECFFFMQEYEQTPFWNDRFFRSIVPGADLSKMFADFAEFLFEDKKVGIIRLLTNKLLYKQVLETVSAPSPDEGKLNELKDQLIDLDKHFQDVSRMTSEYEPAIHLISFTIQPDKKTAEILLQTCAAQFQYGKKGKTWRHLSQKYSERFLEMLITTPPCGINS